ncbi:MAG: hypothetical protein KTR31_00405 [Myxococcales bacterium]|nr:hypothetical protein [Myxococcales bacterium]
MTYRPLPPRSALGAVWPFLWCEVRIGLHKVTLVERLFGFRLRTRSFVFEDLAGAMVQGSRLVLLDQRQRRLRTFVWGDAAQLAWIAGEVGARVRQARMTSEEVDVAARGRQAVLSLAKVAQQSTVA